MTREENTRHSNVTATSQVSNGDSVLSDFDPEQEAIVSTKQLDGYHGVLNRQNVAKEHISTRREPDYIINTSAIERAFPEFSEAPSSEEDNGDDDDTISMEIGRGGQKAQNRLDDSRNSVLSFANSVRSSSPAIKLDYPALQVPSKSAVRSVSKRVAASDSLRKDAQVRRASMMQKENLDPQTTAVKNPVSRGPHREQHRTLSEIHAKVRETYDGSYISDERPSNVAVNTRTTRFGQAGDISAQVAQAVDKASRDVQSRDVRLEKHTAQLRSTQVNTTYNSSNFADTITHQSFLLPDLPNLSELVSGIYEDGTPVFSRQHKSRTTRFVSPSGKAVDASLTHDHLPLHSVPIPDDEKALFVSLKLLQDKVADLELAKSEAERKLEDIRQENVTLKADKSRRQKEQYRQLRSIEDREGEERRDSRRLARFEEANFALQNRLDIADRKIQVHETAIRSLTQERDSAVLQLGIAYLNSQDLKREYETLKTENAELRAQLEKLNGFTQDLPEEPESRQVTRQTQSDVDAMVDSESETNRQHYTQRSLASSRRQGEISTKKTQDKRLQTEFQSNSHTRISNQIDKEMSRIEKQQDETLFSFDIYPGRSSMSRSVKSSGNARSEANMDKKQPNTSKQRTKRVIVGDNDESENVDMDDVVTEDGANETGKDQDLTLLSFIDGHEIAQLRKTLEAERVARKQRESLLAKEAIVVDESNGPRRQPELVQVLPRKSSLKGTKVRPGTAAGETTTGSRANPDLGKDGGAVSERRRCHSDHSVRSRRRSTEEMTSAFILPDITLRYVDSEMRPPVRLSESAQKVLESVAQHDGGNCTVCHRLVSASNDRCHGTGSGRDTITIPKPRPVSSRMPESSLYNEEPTLRPSQPPALALATVLKGLEDELSHLKMQLVPYQNAYNQHDASLSKRQRKSLYQKIEMLLKDIDTKADQIYALYDVLEGQKQDGHEMTEQEVEVTLQSIGVSVYDGRAFDITGATDQSSKNNPVTTDDSEDEEDELPWEGFESTVEMTRRSLGGRKMHS
ncbi:hypothetical protein Egran_00734 [Elaphomyces granulatus]|uniref:Cep57 centrosome microtubule-binding domain-containing protein n=1 Tax=Elaphomyces granulatus TaxID=519963 RepID=A0A232M502_9EURO|nr:hypothetical protein Egran_00734 [Elaphomyces granulatus]